MTIFLGADHRGFSLKEQVKTYLEKEDYRVVDMGAHVYQKDDDYPDYAKQVAEKVAKNVADRGIVFCGSGVGVSIVANKIDGIRCVYAATAEEVANSRTDDNTNMLAVGSDTIPEKEAWELIVHFLTTPYKPEKRFERRLKKIAKIEEHN